ncbi:MAG: hypothetical protein JNL98_26015 [Bryobacterales bacterium]|nr:hypothetical protein [Bryobacterales bacterium]
MLSIPRSVLTYRERMGLAWQLVWPAIVLDVLWCFGVYLIYETIPPKAELLFVIIYLLAVAPWLVRRMMRGKYPGFRLLTLVDGKETAMGYTESFKVMWLLSWRSSVLMLVALFVVSLFGRFLSFQLSTLVPPAEEAPLFNAIGLSIVENGAALFLVPLVMPGMFHKQYQGFRVSAKRV